MVSPPPGCLVGYERAAHGLREPPGEREAEADAGVVVAVAEPLEGQEDPVARRPGGCPARGRRPRSPRARRRRVRARGDEDGAARPAVADGVGDQVDQDPFQQRRVGEHSGRPPGSLLPRPGRAAGRGRRRRTGHDVLECGRLQRQPEHPRLQAAHVEQVGDQAVQLGPGTRRRWRATPSRSCVDPVTSAVRRLSTAALAEASGVRRSWLTAASSAVRILSASASGRAARPPRQAVLPQRHRRLAANASSTRGRTPSGVRPRRTSVTVVVDRDLGRALVGAAAGLRRRRSRRSASSPDRPGGRASAAASARRSSSVTESSPKATRSRSSRSLGVLSPRSTLPARFASTSASALARAASRVRRAARSTTALTATATTTNAASARAFSHSPM